MKVLVNGGLNLSTLDGWWAEAFDPSSGWALGAGLDHVDGDDAGEAAQLYRLLEDEIVPALYDRDEEGLPRRWIAMLRSSMASLAPRFCSVSMLQAYVDSAYLPAASSHRRRTSEKGRVARDLEAWASHLTRHWPAIRFGDLTVAASQGRLTASVPVYLGEIARDCVRVQIYADAQGGAEPIVVEMTPVDAIALHANDTVYRASIETDRPASQFTPRVVPFHPEARLPIELPLIAWQR